MEARLQSLKTEFDLMRMKEDTKIDDFVGKLSGIASKSATLGSPIEEEALVRKLLTSVPDSFINMVAIIEQLVDIKTVKFQEVVGRLKAYEERTNTRMNNNQNQLLLSYEDWEAKRKNEKGGGRGRGNGQDGEGRGRGRGRSPGRGRGQGRGQYNQKGNHANEKKDRTNLQCFRCDAFGYFSFDCPTRKGEKANLAQADTDQPALLMVQADPNETELVYMNKDRVIPSNILTEEQGESVWFLDTGATNHMTGNKDLFSTLDATVKGTVKLGDSLSVQIEGRGSILLETKSGEHKLLTDILYIPCLKNNIFSIGQAEESGWKIAIKQGTLTIVGPDGTLIMKVQRSSSRLYKIVLKNVAPVCLMTRLEDQA